ncbi:hypothetical protein GCK32_012797 [Trichostrongylus colubriformis]|uniref:Uncharacterized protein n=1 Tax=Trichostrongylus colubriformis TaxID=6319 RepID=A0AAN8IYY8_TRICO
MCRRIKFEKNTPKEIRRALRRADKDTTPLVEAQPSTALCQFAPIQSLVSKMPDVQAFNIAEARFTTTHSGSLE